MKILVYGAGIIGCTYGWQLAESGQDVTILVRPGKKEQFEKEGIVIHCNDYRGGNKQRKEVVFRPDIIEQIPVSHEFEYILVTVNCLQLPEILPELAGAGGSAHILFLHNIWDGFKLIASHLSEGSYFFGFPFMAGGGRCGDIIESAISGLKYSHTPLGELNGEITPRLQKIGAALEQAGLKPQFNPDIKTWLITHYVVAAGLSAGIISAGGGRRFIQDKKMIRTTILAIREGLAVCKGRGVEPKKERSNSLYFLPLFIGVPIARKIYSDKGLQQMFDGHTSHAPEEIQKMVADVIEYAKRQGVATPCLQKLQTYMK